MNDKWTVPADIFDKMVSHSEESYPEESCGLLFSCDKSAALEWIPMENIQNKMHARDPDAYPRDARTAYLFDSMKFEKICKEMDERGLTLKSIYHSHPDHDSYFSDKDREDAAPPGWGPLFPGAVYLVFSIREQKLADTKAYIWSDEEEVYVELLVVRGDS
jgi:proteasome lid subunit RPN8/RPN11